ncbi:hypothetical protein JYG32_34085 [Burkholderia pyrrocinia]|nr:hypothetical protein [Burkholderia pyrrocinia]QVN23939.1 hypothetical protein JYG32_34085 [Burkholderia pyrrocinia]
MSPTFTLRVEAFIDTSTDRPVKRFFDHLRPEEGMRMSLARADGQRAHGRPSRQFLTVSGLPNW